MRVRVAKQVRVGLLAVVLLALQAAASHAATITIGTFSLYPDEGQGPFVDLDNLMDAGSPFQQAFGFTPNLTGTLQTCTPALDCTSVETEEVGPADLPILFVADVSGAAFVRMLVSITGLPPGTSLTGIVSADDIALDCVEGSAESCTSFVSFTYRDPDVVPEPATLLLLAGGLATAAFRRR